MASSLGYVTVSTPGTLVRATVNRPVPATRIGVQAITFEVLPANAGLVYIGLHGMDKSTGASVLAILPAPTDATNGPFASFQVSKPMSPAGENAADFYIDAASGGDGVVISYVQG